MTDHGRDLSLLIIDDDERILELAEHAARQSGHFGIIRTAVNGEDALHLLKERPLPDIILSDLSMPRMDGFQLVKALKAQRSTRRIPVVMFSSSGLQYDHERALAAGCEAFVPKPGTLAGLSDVVAKVAEIALRTRRGENRDAVGTAPASFSAPSQHITAPLRTGIREQPRRAKLLLVDDKVANLLALEAVLDAPEYHLLRAQSGAAALELLRQHPDVAVILLDVQMPGMDGMETTRRIKRLPGCRDIPIIFITAIYTEDAFVKQGYRAGAIDYFTKPFDPEILRLKVEIYAGFRRRATLLQEKERQLRDSEELSRTGRKLSTILESLEVGVIITDAKGRICQTNDAVLTILQSADRLQSDSYGEFLEWWDRDGQLLKSRDGPLMRTLLKGDASHNEVVQLKCPDYSVKTVFTSTSPVRGLDGQIRGAVIVIQDVTAHREIGEETEKRIVNLVSVAVESQGKSENLAVDHEGEPH